MLTLTLKFESSWTNSFFTDAGQTPLFTSGSQLSGSLKGIIPGDISLLDGKSRIPYLRDMQSKNPTMAYRVPESYDNTVRGVLSRLCGEVRRVSDLPTEHLCFRAFDAGRYEVKVESEHTETTSLTSYEDNRIQSGGAGLITNEALYGPTDYSRYLFGFLGMSLQEMQDSVDDILQAPMGDQRFQWTPDSPSMLIERLNALGETQDEMKKEAVRQAKEAGLPYTTPLLALARKLEALAPDDASAAITSKAAKAGGPMSVEGGALDDWRFPGALIVLRIRAMSDLMREDFKAAGALTKNGGLAGMSMTGKLGAITEKDMFGFASGKHMVSSRLPLAVEIPVMGSMEPDAKKYFVHSGVIKKTGELIFEIDGQPQLEAELRNAIRDAAVGPIHFGKKGVAYVTKLRLSNADDGE